MDSRKIDLLKILMYQRSLHSIQSLAKTLGCSQRTIRNDIQVLEEWFKENGLATIKRVSNYVGISDDVQESKLLDELSEARLKLLDDSPELRANMMIKLILEKGKISAYQLSKILNISDSTVFAHVKPLSKILSEYQLELIRDQSFLSIVGNEVDKRKVYTYAVKNSSKYRLIHYTDDIEERMVTLKNLMDPVVVDEVRQRIDQLQQGKRFEFSIEAYINIIIHIVCAIARIKEGKVIDIADEELEKLMKKHEFTDSEEVCLSLEQRFDIHFPLSEIAYTTYHLLGASVAYNETDEWIQSHEHLLQDIEHVIDQVEQLLHIEYPTREKLKRGLLLHIVPALQRMSLGRPVENPLLVQFQVAYGDVYEATRLAMKPFELKYDVSFNEDEICYLAMHFLSNISHKSRLTVGTKLLLVCSSGTGTSQLLKSRLSFFFKDFDVVDVVSKSKLKDVLKETSVDIIVSTIHLTNTAIETVEVTPLLSQMDIEKLSKYLQRREVSDASLSLASKQILDVVSEYVDDKTLEEIQVELRRRAVIPLGNIQPLEAKLKEEAILEESFILLIEPCSDLDELIDTCAHPLLFNNRIMDKYVSLLKNHYKQHPGWIMIAPGIAMPHSFNDGDVLQTSISLAFLKTPQPIDHRFGPIDTVIFLAPMNKTDHVELLSRLVEYVSVVKHRDRFRHQRASEIYSYLMKEVLS